MKEQSDWIKRIEWVDAYVARIKPFVRVRKADSLLIKIPNQAYKLNSHGFKILDYLLSGGKTAGILDAYQEKEKVSLEIYWFFRDLAALLKGCYDEKEERMAVTKTSFALPYNSLPVLSEIALTYRCNLACKFCYASCSCKKNDVSPELSAVKVKEVLEIINSEAEVPSVSFTGGEPALREDLPELVAYAKHLGMWTNLISNGTLLTPEKAGALKQAGLDSAQISIEGGSGAVHDAITTVQGSFDAALSGIKNLRQAGIRVHTNTTVSGLNKDHLNEIIALVRASGLKKFSMNMLMPVGSADANSAETFISYTEIGRIIPALKSEAAAAGLEFMWYSPVPMCIFNPVAAGLGNKGCAACDGLLSIAPNGNILPCSSYAKPVGNILESKGSFAELWSGASFRFFQEKKFAPDICRQCPELPVCNGACPLYWERAGIAELIKAGTEYLKKGAAYEPLASAG